VDDRELVRVEELDRVLDRDDVVALLAVDLVDEGGERGGLARAGGPGDEDEAARLLREGLDHGRERELGEAADLEGDRPEGAGDLAALLEDVGAEAGEALDTEREVDALALLEPGPLRLVHHLEAQGAALGRREVGRPERDELSIDAELRGRAGGDVEIGRALLEHRLEELPQR